MTRNTKLLFAVWLIIGLALLCWLCPDSRGATYYIKGTASGANTGGDWTDAFTNWPTMTRGDTYYFSDLSWGSVTFDTAHSGTSVITLKKATVADHGTETGWSDAMGDGQAVFTAFNFEMGNLLVDGTTNYGFRVQTALGQQGIRASRVNGATITNIVFRNVESCGPAGSDPYPYEIGDDCTLVYIAFFQGCTIEGLSFSNCYFHGATTLFQTAGINDLLVEHCVFADSRIDYGPGGYDPAKPHDNVAFIQNPGPTIFRFNTVSNWDVTGFYPNGAGSGEHVIYGNYFYNGESAIWFYATITGADGTWLIHNNTFREIWNRPIYQDGGADPTGGATNNIFYHMDAIGNDWRNLAHDFNWYSEATDDGEANGVASATVNPFDTNSTVPTIATNIAATYPRDKGANLGAPFDVDFFGNTRGTDGTWDIGAMESQGTYEPPPTPPGNVAVATANNATVGTLVVSAGPPAVIARSPFYLTFETFENTTQYATLTVSNAGLPGCSALVGSATHTNLAYTLTNTDYTLGYTSAQTIGVAFLPTTVGTSNDLITLSGGGGTTVALLGTATNDVVDTNWTANAIVYWKMDEGSGATLIDSASGNENGGTNNADWVADPTALDYNGSSDASATTNTVTFATNTVTVVFWMKPDTTDSGQMLVELGGPTYLEQGDSFAIYQGDDPTELTLAMVDQQGNYLFCPYTLTNTAAYTHVAALLQKSGGETWTNRLWLDAVEQNPTTGGNFGVPSEVDSTNVWSEATLYVGARAGTGTRYAGNLRQFAILPGARTAAQIEVIKDATQ